MSVSGHLPLNMSYRPQEVRERRAQRRSILDDADDRVSCGHDALALRQARPRHDSALWRRGVVHRRLPQTCLADHVLPVIVRVSQDCASHQTVWGT